MDEISSAGRRLISRVKTAEEEPVTAELYKTNTNQMQYSVLTELKRQSVLRFCHDDKSSTVDSNSRKIVKVDNEKHVRRVRY